MQFSTLFLLGCIHMLRNAIKREEFFTIPIKYFVGNLQGLMLREGGFQKSENFRYVINERSLVVLKIGNPIKWDCVDWGETIEKLEEKTFEKCRKFQGRFKKSGKNLFIDLWRIGGEL